MSEKEFMWKMRVRIFEEANKKEMSVVGLCKKYGVSRSWYYNMPNKIPKEIEEEIPNFVKNIILMEPNIEQRVEARFQKNSTEMKECDDENKLETRIDRKKIEVLTVNLKRV